MPYLRLCERNEAVGAGVEAFAAVPLNNGEGVFRYFLAELYAGLVETIEPPNKPLGKYLVFISRNNCAEAFWRELLNGEQVIRVIARVEVARAAVFRTVRHKLSVRQTIGYRQLLLVG